MKTHPVTMRIFILFADKNTFLLLLMLVLVLLSRKQEQENRQRAQIHTIYLTLFFFFTVGSIVIQRHLHYRHSFKYWNMG